MGWTVIKNGRRVCITCREEKDCKEFYAYLYVTKQGKDSVRHESRCIPCARARRRAKIASDPERNAREALRWRESNADMVKAYASAYRKTERGLLLKREAENRRRLNGGTVEGPVYKRVLLEAKIGDLYLDAYDGNLIADPTLDHIVPLSAGGNHTYENLCVTSKTNNSKKRNKPLLYWMATR